MWPLPPDPFAGEQERTDESEWLPLLETVERFESTGVRVVSLIASSQDDWDRYETLKWQTFDEWLAANPGHPQADEFRARGAAERARYLALGARRDELGDLRLPHVSVSPARRAAYEVLLRVFEQDAYADRAFRTAAEGLDERERAFAQRLAYGSVQRVRTLDHAIDTLGKRPVRKLDPPVRAALRLGAYQLGYTDTAPHAAANESVELVRRARLERAVPFTNAVMRRLTDGIRPLLDALPDGALKESYPDWIYETFVRVLGAGRRARAHARDERAARDRRAPRRRRAGSASRPTFPARTASSGSTTSPSPTGGSGRRAAAPSSRRSASVRRTASASSTSAPRRAARPARCAVTSRRSRSTRTARASCARTSRRCAATDVTVVEADGTALPPELDRLRPRARRRAVLRPRRPRAAAGPPLARDAAARAPARAPPLRGRARQAGRDDRLLGLHAQPGRVRGGRRRERPRVVPLGEEWPQFAHPSRPEFLLTLPHVHGTSGFFIARLTA